MHFWDVNGSHAVTTSAGLCGLWRPARFAQVTELASWEDEVADDSALTRHISAGAFVPINVGGNGAFQVTVRGTEAHGRLSDREQNYLLGSSEPYLLVSDGAVELGGLEAVGSYSGADKVEIPLESGRYAVVVHLVDWQAESGALDENGKPSLNAFPDFIVEIFDELPGGGTYRTKMETFERP